MKKIDLQVKDKDHFFEELLSRCKHNDCYSVREAAEKMGVVFEEALNWAKFNENWTYTIELCRELCYFHAEDASLEGLISEKEAMKYMLENREKYL